MMELREIAKAWLEANGYDGLCHGDTECGCLNDDLMPCGEPSMLCTAGYSVPVPEGCDGAWWISPDKPGKETDDA